MYFSLRGQEYAIGERRATATTGNLEELMEQLRDQAAEGMQGAAAASSMTPEELAEMLYRSLLNGERRR